VAQFQISIHTDVLIIDASKHFIKEGTTNKLQASDIKRIADTVANRKEITKFSREISRDEIRANEYNLNIPRYVDSSEEAETWDIYASMFGGIPTKELAQLQKYWWTFPSLQKALFEEKTSEHVILKVENIEDMINNHPDIAAFKNSFTSKFADYGNLLSQQLIDNMSVLDILQVRETLSEDIFTRLKSVPLIDA
jgi:type I restriction enzyme M protein